MDGYTPFPIFDFQSGIYSAKQPWLAPKDAFSSLVNAYIYQGILKKRNGYAEFGRFVHTVENEISRINAKCSVAGEDEPDRDFLDVLLDEYEINEKSSPLWTGKEVTVGLPQGHDWKMAWAGTALAPIKKAIPKAEMLTLKTIRRKVG